MSAQSALSILRGIEQQNIASRAMLDDGGKSLTEWRGLAFKVGDIDLVTSIADILEILDPLKCTPIPKSKMWFKGVANVRGNLIPVMDFYCFMNGMALPNTNDTRVLVFRHANALAGVVVSAVLGLRQFYQSELVEKRPDGLREDFADFVRKSFQRTDQAWGVFDFSLLANTDAFLSVSELRK